MVGTPDPGDVPRPQPTAPTENYILPPYESQFNDRIQNAFAGDPERGYFPVFLDNVLFNWRATEDRLRRTAFLLFLVCAFGLFFSLGRIAQIQIVGFQLKNTALIQWITPVVVSYLLYEFCNLIVTSNTYQQLHRSLIICGYPKVSRNQLDPATEPPLSLVFGESFWTDYNLSLPAGAAVILSAIRPFVIIGAPVAYIIYQYLHIVSIYGLNPQFWISVSLTAALAGCALAVMSSWLLSGVNLPVL